MSERTRERLMPNWGIEELSLLSRTYNSLRGEGIKTIGDLIRRTPPDLLDIRNFGAGMLRDVEERLAHYEMRLSTDDEVYASGWEGKIIGPITIVARDRMGVPVLLYLHSGGTFHQDPEEAP